ncbi:MAG: flagellar hook-basal body complex protein, partial [Cyanobacteria bacterium P01_G01_bin.4]
MSLYGMMRTGVSGMDAQATKLSTVADNIANANTTGYKKFEALFSTQVVNQSGGSYYSGGVTATARQMVSQQGVLEFTNSSSDLAISGNGFFVVQDPAGVPQLTRAGSFVPNADGELVNAAGFTLMGYSFANGVPASVANGFEGLEPVQISETELLASASTASNLTANLPSASPIVTGTTAGGNLATSEFTSKTSIVAYDSLGDRILLDVYFTKTADETWEVAIYDQADASPNTSFPYSSAALSTTTLTFDPTS